MEIWSLLGVGGEETPEGEVWVCGREDRGLINVGAVVTAVEYVMLCYIRRKSQSIQAEGQFPFVPSLCL